MKKKIPNQNFFISDLGQSSSGSYSHSPSHIEEIQVRPQIPAMIDTTAVAACSESWPARVNMPTYEVKDMAVHEVAPIQMPASGLYHLKSVSAALDEHLNYPRRTSNRDEVQNNWREQSVCICDILVILYPRAPF